MFLSESAVIRANDKIFNNYYLLEVEAIGVGKARPGQFYMVKIGNGTDPLLRRPFCLHKTVSDDIIKILYRAGGYGTKLLTKLVKGDTLNVLGPLGNGFIIGGEVKRVLLVAGGIGVAPMVALAEEIKRKKLECVCFIGGRGRDDVLGIHEFKELGFDVHTSTEDGSVGRKGYVTAPLEDYILKHQMSQKASDLSPSPNPLPSRERAQDFDGLVIYSCGPTPMMQGVAALADRHGIKNYASLEANMACGIGACMGCVVPVIDKEHGTTVYKKVCEDGPVFDTDDVAW